MSHRLRSVSTTVLVVLGGVALAASVSAIWASNVIFDSDHFTDRATDALSEEAVATVVADALVDQIITHGSSELMTVRPLLLVIVEQAVRSRPFQALYRPALREMHASVFGGDDAVVLRLVDFMIVLSAAIESFDTDLAAQLPELRTALIELRRRDFAVDAIVFSSHLRFFTWLMPLLCALFWAAALSIAPNRRRTAVTIGFAGAVVGAALIVGNIVGRAWLAEAVTDPAESEAVEVIWRVFARDLVRWSLGLAVLGIAFAAGASSSFRKVDVRADVEYLQRVLAWRPESRWGRVLLAILMIALAWLLLWWPARMVEAVVIIIGLYLLYVALIELVRASRLGMMEEDDAASADAGHGFWRNLGSQSARWAVVAVVVLLLGLAALAILREPERQELRAPLGDEMACNGHPALCDRRLDEIALPGTHNSMSAASEPGWFFASHEHGIREQLEFGIRVFLIDVYYGIRVQRGVRTDLFHDRDRDELVAEYGAEFVAARDRIVESMGAAEAGARREIFMCHGFCELGATPLSETLQIFKAFLDTHPREVVVIMIQDEVPAADVAAAFEAAGLASYAYTHHPGSQFPTLGEMIGRGERLLVMAENDGSGPDWYHAGFELTQETPYSFKSAAEFSCEPNRGRPDSPLFLLNHWIERVTPSPADADSVNRYDVLLKRALTCQSRRGMMPNLIAVNFYGHGDLMRVVQTLNGLDGSYRE